MVDAPSVVVKLPARPLTLDDVTALAAADDAHRYELDRGALLVMPPPDVEHATLITHIITWLVAAGHPAEHVLATPGVRIAGQSSGRCPDAIVLRRAVAGSTVWIEPADIALVIEIVSPGSETVDRTIKPTEYAGAGITHFWRIERDQGAATVHQYTLGTDEQGDPTYLGHHAELLTDLLATTPPTLT